VAEHQSAPDRESTALDATLSKKAVSLAKTRSLNDEVCPLMLGLVKATVNVHSLLFGVL